MAPDDADAGSPVFLPALKMWYTGRMRALASLWTARPATEGRHPEVRFVLVAIVVLAFGLRLARLTFQPLWWDEGWSLYFAASDVPTLLQLTSVDIHPPLYYLLLRLWIGIVGSGVVAVRMLSVLIGTAAVPLLFVIGRRLLGRSGGLLAASLLAIAPLHVYYSQEVRMYGLVTLFGLAATCLALRWTSGTGPGWVSLVGYVVTAAAALYTQYYAAFLLLGLNLALGIHWLQQRRSAALARHRLWAWLASQGAVLLLFAPWLWYAGERLGTYVRFKVGVEGDLSLGFLPYVGRQLAAFTWGHVTGLEAWWWLGLLPLAALLVGLALSRWLPRRGAAIAADGARQPKPWGDVWTWAGSVTGIVLICGFAVNVVLPFNPPHSERLLLLAQPAYLLLVAGGLQALWFARRGTALLIAVTWLGLAFLSLALFYAVPRYPLDDYRPVAGQLRREALPSDAIICVHPWQVGYFYAYLPKGEARPSLILTPREVLPRERQLWADDPTRLTADLDSLLAAHGRLWVPAHQAMGRVLEDQIAIYLAGHAYPVASTWYGENTVLSLYASGQPDEPAPTGSFGPWLILESANLAAGPFEAGWGIVPIDLTWRVLAHPAEPYQTGLRLVGSTGYVWAQRDALPVDGLEPFAQWALDKPGQDRHGLRIPAGTPPGEYRVVLQVYRSRDFEALPVTSAGVSGSELTLGTVRIVRPAVPPPPEALAPEQVLEADFGPLHLWGVTVRAEQPAMPGQALEVELFWQAQSAPGEDLLPRLQLLHGELVLAEWLEKPVEGTYPTAWWQPGELVRDPHSLHIPATVPAGRYRLILGVVRAADGHVLATRGGTATLELGEAEVEGREHTYTPPAPQHKQVAALGPRIELRGYDLASETPAPGALLEVTLYWHALETPADDYRAFVHLLDADDNIVAQHDSVPGEGRLPTLGWLPGEYLADRHLLHLPTGLAPGRYRLSVGLYDPVTWQRPAEPVVLDAPLVIGPDNQGVDGQGRTMEVRQ